LHEFASGTLDIDDQSLDYIAQAHWHHFRFRLGAMEGLDRERREVIVAPAYGEDGKEVTPRRRLGYDTLVIAVGSTNNDFGTPGVREHTIRLETKDDAGRFHRRLIDAYLRANTPVAGWPRRDHHRRRRWRRDRRGALRRAAQRDARAGVVRVGPRRPDRDVRIVLIEAGPRILPALPERLSIEAHQLLDDLGVEVMTGRRVTGVDADGVTLDGGERIDADLKVWAAGIKAPIS
jgi:NADH dehydrogenase